MAAAIGIGSIHTPAPDHWVPFAALARAAANGLRGALRSITATCGLGHVTGIGGSRAVAACSSALSCCNTSVSASKVLPGLLLIGFGVAYAVWGIATERPCAPART